MQDPQGKLAENIVYFARALRAAGIPVGPGSVLDALDLAQHLMRVVVEFQCMR